MTNDLTFYDQLLKFQLFQGLSRTELLQMAGNTKFGFMKLPAGKTIVNDGDVCQQMLFLINGSIHVRTQADDHSFSVGEEMTAPWLLQPEALFGLHTRYTCTAHTITGVHFITLQKDEVMRMVNDFLIFRLNLLNLLATQSQRRGRWPWRHPAQSLRERIVRFLLDHSIYPAGRKEFSILMSQLAQHVADSRRDVSTVLNQLQDEGLLELHRGRIVVPSLERLFM